MIDPSFLDFENFKYYNLLEGQNDYFLNTFCPFFN